MRDGLIDRGFSQARALTQTTPHLTISNRLARLRQLREAWKTLSWTRCVTVPMPGPCGAYELVGGAFCKTQPTVWRGWGWGGALALGGLPWFANGVDGNAHEEHEEARTMSVTWLPGTHDYWERTVVRDDLGIQTRDFAIDPSQDLMVLFKGREEAGLYVAPFFLPGDNALDDDDDRPMAAAFPGVLELHVRTISTNQPHPEARIPVLCTPVLWPVTCVSMQIVDDVVGVSYCIDPLRIMIWNWKTGHLVVVRPRAASRISHRWLTD